jgi:Kef-type K+ transport system membrane component KefB
MASSAEDGPVRNWPGSRLRVLIGMAAGLVVLAAALVTWGSSLFGGSVKDAATDPVFRFLLVAAVILLLSHLLGAVLAGVRQPPVVGEMMVGILLGPSILGVVWPEARQWLFPPAVLNVLGPVSQLGLVIFCFLLGCELRTDLVRTRSRTVIGVVTGGMALPLIGGILIAFPARHLIAGASASPWTYELFVGLALSITALPVLARILVDLRQAHTPVGTMALASAAFGDGIGWTLLAIVVALHGGTGKGRLPITVGAALAIVTVAVFTVRPALAHVTRRAEAAGNVRILFPVLFGGALIFGAATQLIGLHAASGAFLFGTIVPRRVAVVSRLNQQMQGFAVGILLPLFFASVGLDVVIGLVGSPTRALLFAALLLAACATKFVGAGTGALLTGSTRKESVQLGVLMNCRGVTELIVVSIGWQDHIINTLGLTIMVLIAVITTMITAPLAHWLARGSPGRPATWTGNGPGAGGVTQAGEKEPERLGSLP